MGEGDGRGAGGERVIWEGEGRSRPEEGRGRQGKEGIGRKGVSSPGVLS